MWGDDEIKSFKLEIPSIFSSKSLQMYYDQAGNWTEVNANISKDKIVMPDWTRGSCGFKYIIFRLKDEKNKVNAKGVYIKDCDSYRKKDELAFITKCTTHLK